jgi:hypothetical protein
MGRELKRVALDFDWPRDEVWEGYINPHFKKCPTCKNGQTEARNQLERLASLITWLGYSTMRGGHNWHPMFESTHISRPIDPKLFEVINGLVLAGSKIKQAKYRTRKPEGLSGLGSGDDYSITLLLLRNAGLPLDWGICPECHGDDIDPKVKVAYDAWKKTEPPVGDGYQVWETVSEGSPISPVFETSEACVTWLISEGYSRSAAEAFVKQGWVPSMIMINAPGKPVQIFKDIESADFKG